MAVQRLSPVCLQCRAVDEGRGGEGDLTDPCRCLPRTFPYPCWFRRCLSPRAMFHSDVPFLRCPASPSWPCARLCVTISPRSARSPLAPPVDLCSFVEWYARNREKHTQNKRRWIWPAHLMATDMGLFLPSEPCQSEGRKKREEDLKYLGQYVSCP